MPSSERAAVHESAAADAVRGREIASLETVLCRKPQHAIAPQVGIRLVAELFASRAIDADHVVDVALHLGCPLGLRHAAGEEDHHDGQGECTHGCLLSSKWKRGFSSRACASLQLLVE